MNEEQLRLLLQILGSQGGAASPLLGTAASAGVTPSSITSLLNPEMLVASGLVNPAQISAGIADTEQQLLAKFLAETNAVSPKPYEASAQSLAPFTGKYGIQTAEAPGGSVQFAPSGADDLSEYMATQYNAIASGQITAQQAKEAFARKATSSDAYKALVPYQTQIASDLDAFEKQVGSYRNANLKWEYDNASKQSQTGPAPTRTQALTEYYKSIGAPQLALLGDPSMGYQIPAQSFADTTKLSNLEKELARQQSTAARYQNRFAGAATEANKQAQAYTQKAIVDEARRRGLAAQAAYDKSQETNIVDETVNKVIDWFSKGRVIKDVLGTDMTDKRKKAYQDAFDKAVKELSSQPAPTVGIGDVSKDYALAKAKEYTAAKKIADEQNRASEVARLVSEGLAARGKTPYADQLNRLLGYAVTAKTSK